MKWVYILEEGLTEDRARGKAESGVLGLQKSAELLEARSSNCVITLLGHFTKQHSLEVRASCYRERTYEEIS
jgi:hypothetical protein